MINIYLISFIELYIEDIVKMKIICFLKYFIGYIEIQFKIFIGFFGNGTLLGGELRIILKSLFE